MSDANNVPELQDHVFTLGAGEVMSGGKSHYSDLVRLRIPKDRALEFALDILTGLKNIREGDELLFEKAMFGTLEKVTND